MASVEVAVNLGHAGAVEALNGGAPSYNGGDGAWKGSGYGYAAAVAWAAAAAVVKNWRLPLYMSLQIRYPQIAKQMLLIK